jgi:hypothetical protein
MKSFKKGEQNSLKRRKSLKRVNTDLYLYLQLTKKASTRTKQTDFEKNSKAKNKTTPLVKFEKFDKW